jgi:hypothetical protein
MKSPKPKPPPATPRPSPGGVQRQQRYRVANDIGSLDIARVVLQRLEALRSQTGQTNETLLTRALDLLEAQLAQPTPSPVRRKARPAAGPAKASPPAALVPAAPQKPSPVDGTVAPLGTQFDLLGGAAESSVKRRRSR